MYLEPFPSPAVVVIKVNEKVISFFTSGERRCMNISHVLNKTDKVLNSLTLLAPQKLEWISSSSEYLYVTVT